MALGLLQLWYGKLKLVFSPALVWQLLSIASSISHCWFIRPARTPAPSELTVPDREGD